MATNKPSDMETRIMRQSLASEFGERLSSSTSFNADVEYQAESKRNVTFAPITFLRDLCAESPFGKLDHDVIWDGAFTLDELNGMPEPGTGTKENPAKGNAMPDVYETAKNGKTVKASFYGDMLESTKLWQKVQDELDEIEKGTHLYCEHGPVRVASEKARLKKIQSTGLNNLRNAVRLHRQIRRIVEELDGIIIKPMLAKVKLEDGSFIYEFCDVEACLEILDKVNVSQARGYTPAQVLRLDLDAIIAKGGRITDLFTQGNGTQDGDAKKTLAPVIKDIKQFLDYIDEISVYTTRDDFNKRMHVWIESCKKSDVSALMGFCGMMERMKPLYDPALEAWYTEKSEKRANIGKQKAA